MQKAIVSEIRKQLKLLRLFSPEEAREETMAKEGEGMYAHSYAIEIEHIMGRLIGCNRFGAPFVNADEIEDDWNAAIAFALGYIYAIGDEEVRTEISRFYEKNDMYLGFSIAELLQFTGRERTIGIATYTLDYENGEKAIEELIASFENLCSKAEKNAYR